MKTFALAATVAALLCTASSADAQYRRTSGYNNGTVYAYPSYSPSFSPTYINPTFGVPAYNGVVGAGSFTPLGGTTIIVPSGGVPSYGSPLYYNQSYNNSSYGGFYPATQYYNFNGSSVTPYPYGMPYRSSPRGWR